MRVTIIAGESRVNVERFASVAGVNVTMIRSEQSPLKNEAHPFGPLSDEARAYVQSRINDAGANFIKAVAGGRRVSQTKVREEYGQGRMFGVKDAVSRGMADRVATLDQVIGGMVAQIPLARGVSRRRSALAFEQLVAVRVLKRVVGAVAPGNFCLGANSGLKSDVARAKSETQAGGGCFEAISAFQPIGGERKLDFPPRPRHLRRRGWSDYAGFNANFLLLRLFQAYGGRNRTVSCLERLTRNLRCRSR